MRIIFFGLGSIGRRHLELIEKNYPQTSIFAWQRNSGSSKIQEVTYVTNWKELLKIKPEIAFITNPTSLHLKTALACAKIGCQLFIEKPLGHNLDHFSQLLKVVEKNNLSAYVAYNLRFHPVIRELAQYLEKDHPLHVLITCTSYFPLWRPKTNWRQNYSRYKKMGGGVVFDLSHELDYSELLFGEILRISGQLSKRSQITVDSEDCADLLLETKNTIVNLHLNYCSHFRTRTVQIDFPKFSLIADINKQTIKKYEQEKLIKTFHYNIDRNFTYEQEQKYFFTNLGSRRLKQEFQKSALLFKKIVEFKKKYG